MRALKDRAGIAERLALVLCGALLAALLFVFHVEAKISSPAKAVTANTHCRSDYPHVPCLGPIESLYNYEGEGNDQVAYLKAKFGANSKPSLVFEAKPSPGQYEVRHRTVTWHSRSNVEIVAVYLVHNSARNHAYQKLPTGPHRGHTTLTATKGVSVSNDGGDVPILLLEGRHGARQAQAASKPTTAFQCEKRFRQAQSRAQCFNHLPGASCAHPLEAQKAGDTTRGEHRYFKFRFEEERRGETVLEHYAYAPAKNVAICPHGAIYNTAQMYLTLPNGEVRSREHDARRFFEPTTRTGGEFSYVLSVQPVMDAYLIVKGYFIHPPWGHRA